MAQAKKEVSQGEVPTKDVDSVVMGELTDSERANEGGKEAVIYIGASFRGVASGTVFCKGELPPALKMAAIAKPAINELIIPISRLIEAKRMLHDPRSAMSRFYEASRSYMKGE